MPQQLFVLTPGMDARLYVQVDVPTLGPSTSKWVLPSTLLIRDRDGTVISKHSVNLTVECLCDPPAPAGGAPAATGKVPCPGKQEGLVVLPEDEATKAAMLLAQRPGTWELVVGSDGTPGGCTDVGEIIDFGEARSTYAPTASRSIPTGCTDCGSDEPQVPVWNPANNYSTGSIVKYQGKEYVAKCDIPAGKAPPA